MIKLSVKAARFIVWFCWAIFLFISWVLMSLAQGTENQWWSMLSLNPEKSSPGNLEISPLRIFIFACLSVIVAYFINGVLWKQEKQ